MALDFLSIGIDAFPSAISAWREAGFPTPGRFLAAREWAEMAKLQRHRSDYRKRAPVEGQSNELLQRPVVKLWPEGEMFSSF